MEFIMGNLLPLLIFIAVPIIRGLNNSKKQKMEYERRRNIRRTPYEQPEVPAEGNFRSIIKELRRNVEEELRKNIQGEPNMEDAEFEEGELETEEPFVEEYTDYGDREIQMAEYPLDKPVEVVNAIKEDSINIDLDRKTPGQDLSFSPNPIVQALIFSEILGPPKSRR